MIHILIPHISIDISLPESVCFGGMQVQRSQIKPSRISKIFVTHAHGDHTFGLPGIMCLMGMEREQFEDVPVDIYGPEGLRMYLRTTIRFTLSRIVPRYRVHEIKNIPMLHKRCVHNLENLLFVFFNHTDNLYIKTTVCPIARKVRPITHASPISMRLVGFPNSCTDAGSPDLVLGSGKWATSYTLDMDESALAMDPRFGEVEGGQDIYPDSQGLWTLVNDDNMVVQVRHA